MKTKNANPSHLLKDKKVNPLIEFYFELNHLKQLYRQGWLLRGIPEAKCESVADHLFGSTILTLFIADTYYPNLNMSKLLEMTLIHELGEIYVGDVTPKDYIPRNLKYEWEAKAVIKIFSKIQSGKKYIHLWKEYEEGRSPEAKLIKQIDLLEAAFQSVIYRVQYNNKNTEDFIPWTKKRLKDKRLLALLDEMEKLMFELT